MHPSCIIDRVDRIQLVPTKYRITYHYNPKYVYRGQTAPDFCTKSCSNTKGSNSALCEAWEKTVQAQRAGESAKDAAEGAAAGAGNAMDCIKDPMKCIGLDTGGSGTKPTDWDAYMKYIGIGTAVISGVIIIAIIAAVIAKKRKHRNK